MSDTFNKKITDLDTITTIAGTDITYISDGSSDNQVTMAQMQTYCISTLGASVASLQTWAGSITTWQSQTIVDISALSTSVASLNTWAGSITSWQSQTIVDISALSTSVASLQTWAGSITSWQSQTIVDISALSTSVASLSVWAGSIATQVNALSTSVLSLQTWAGSITTWQSQTIVDISALSTSVASLSTWASSITTAVASLSTWAGSITTQIAGAAFKDLANTFTATNTFNMGTLPNSFGASSQFLQTAGNGTLTWASTSAGGGAAKWTAITGYAIISETVFHVTTTAMATYPAGTPIRHAVTTSTYYYAMITAVASATGNLTIEGVGLTSTSAYIDYADPNRLKTLVITDNGAWSDGVDAALLASDLLMKGGYVWQDSPAYLVNFKGYVTSADTGSVTGLFNVSVNSLPVCSLSANGGIAPSITGATSGIAINTANYKITYGQSIEFVTGAEGSNDDSKDLTGYLNFVME